MQTKLYQNRVRWLSVINKSGLVIPPFSLVQAVGSQVQLVSKNIKIEEFDVLHVAQPGQAYAGPSWSTPAGGVLPSLITNDVQILANGRGLATFDTPMYATYTPGDGTPKPGDVWGAYTGSFALRKGGYGFRIAGAPGTAQNLGRGVGNLGTATNLVQVVRGDGFSGARAVNGNANAGNPTWPRANIRYDTDGYTGVADPFQTFTVPYDGFYRFGGSSQGSSGLTLVVTGAAAGGGYYAVGGTSVVDEDFLQAGTTVKLQNGGGGTQYNFWITRIAPPWPLVTAV